MTDHSGPPERPGGKGPGSTGPEDARPHGPERPANLKRDSPALGSDHAVARDSPASPPGGFLKRDSPSLDSGWPPPTGRASGAQAMPAMPGGVPWARGPVVPPLRPQPAGRTALALDAVPAWAARAVVGTAVLAGALVVGAPLGLGLTLVLLALCAIVARVRRAAAVPAVDLRTRPEPARRDRWTRVWWALAVGLSLVPTLRAAVWVVVPCLVVCMAVASLAASDGRRWGELWAGLGAVWVRLPQGGFLAGAAAARGASFGPVARGAGGAAALLAVFVPLLVSADAAFAELLGSWAPSLDMPIERFLVAAIFLALGGGLLFVAVAPFRPAPVPVSRTLARAEWTLPLGALVALLGGFVALQLTILFGGDAYVQKTAGLTYAEYARNGFGQLVAVAALTLAVVGAAARWARDDRGSLLRVLLSALCVLTLVMLVSALHRLQLLEDAYGFTRLRFAAHAILLWLGALFVLVLVGRGAGWLPRAMLTITVASFLAFALADPDRRIAEWNVDRYERTGKVDATYLGRLSADAIPALKGMECVPPMPDRYGIGGLNLARRQAIASGVTGKDCRYRDDWG